jgi:predicted nucleic acid-binding protein
MNIVFADTGYWIALLDRQDTLHDKAVELSQTIAPGRIMTTEMVLTEVPNYFANRGRFLRAATIAMLQPSKSWLAAQVYFNRDLLCIGNARTKRGVILTAHLFGSCSKMAC